jgi:hypothetical protein
MHRDPAALAWGCRGHEAIALIALRDMTPVHAYPANALLNKFPSTTKDCLSRDSCMAVAAHESTWADDYRLAHRGLFAIGTRAVIPIDKDTEPGGRIPTETVVTPKVISQQSSERRDSTGRFSWAGTTAMGLSGFE